MTPEQEAYITKMLDIGQFEYRENDDYSLSLSCVDVNCSECLLDRAKHIGCGEVLSVYTKKHRPELSL